jgi:hypothetical protein
MPVFSPRRKSEIRNPKSEISDTETDTETETDAGADAGAGNSFQATWPIPAPTIKN